MFGPPCSDFKKWNATFVFNVLGFIAHWIELNVVLLHIDISQDDQHDKWGKKCPSYLDSRLSLTCKNIVTTQRDAYLARPKSTKVWILQNLWHLFRNSEKYSISILFLIFTNDLLFRSPPTICPQNCRHI